MKELKFRDLKADEIELRVGNTKRKNPKLPKGENNPVVGFQLLMYKTARVDSNILDETVGPFNWTKKFYQVKNTMFCSTGINMNYDDPSKEPYWVYKDDAGDDDFTTEAVKGEASDATKRSAFCWGIGRKNLYYGPFIWINCNDNINEFSKLYVSEVEYIDGIISKIVIRERQTDEVVYSYPKGQKVAQTSQKADKKANVDYIQTIKHFLTTISDGQQQQFWDWVDGKLHKTSVDQLNEEEAKRICNSWGLR